MEELKKVDLAPCPFCGSQPAWCGDDPEEPHSCHQIHCDGCGFQIDIDNDFSRSRETMEELRLLMAMTWNKRAEVN